jgi:probable H4MPT-linked C1 transfer pathway protein
MNTLGLDIGGANLKALHTGGRAGSLRFALWKAPEQLADRLREFLAGCPLWERIALTMTGELCDCFESKRQGVLHILDSVESVSGGVPIHVWTNQGRFASMADARQNPLPVASANWLALATAVGRLAPSGPALLIDIGSTTTDIIPLIEGVPVPSGRTDSERFDYRELVYIGWRRTPLCAFTGTSRAAELYATTLDAYLVLKVVTENSSDTDTADGRPATRAAANRRLSRMLGGDLETTPQRECDQLAREIHSKVVGQIALAVNKVAERLPAPARTVIASGSGEFLIRNVLSSILFKMPMTDCQIISLGKELGEPNSDAACAHAVAVLCEEMHGS